jgi:hypothetical protein
VNVEGQLAVSWLPVVSTTARRRPVRVVDHDAVQEDRYARVQTTLKPPSGENLEFEIAVECRRVVVVPEQFDDSSARQLDAAMGGHHRFSERRTIMA